MLNFQSAELARMNWGRIDIESTFEPLQNALFRGVFEKYRLGAIQHVKLHREH